MWAAENAAPTRAPAPAPIEKAAWKCGRIARPTCCSTSAPLRLMGTFMSAPLTPLRKAPTAKIPTLPAAVPHATSSRATRLRAVAATRVLRLPNRDTIAPVETTANRAPTAPTMRISPSWAEETPSASRIEGSRVIQLVPTMPKSAKSAINDQRARPTARFPDIG
ncbi:hypothetical protein D3C74_383330 [compost metagenome]